MKEGKVNWTLKDHSSVVFLSFLGGVLHDMVSEKKKKPF